MQKMKKKVLIVDDAQMNREILIEILGDEYEILEADNGRGALDLIDARSKEIAAILLDLNMPEMDGFEVLQEMQRKKYLDRIPVLVISGESSVQNEKKCFEMGVSDFIGKPFHTVLVKKRVENMVNHYTYKNQLEEKVQEQTAVLRKAYQTLMNQAEKLEKKNQDIIDMMGSIVEYRSLESGEHIQRVKGFTKILAENFSIMYPEYGLTREKIDAIVAASSLHDIGKIAIPDSILMKPGRLTKDEFEYMKSHTLRGCEILDSMKMDWNPVAKQVSYEIVRSHHERYDGKGYPDGLKGDDIPISAQLVSVADVYDALTSERCYKDKFTPEEAFRMIVNGECGVFSPKMMEAFRRSREQFEEFAKNPVV